MKKYQVICRDTETGEEVVMSTITVDAEFVQDLAFTHRFIIEDKEPKHPKKARKGPLRNMPDTPAEEATGVPGGPGWPSGMAGASIVINEPSQAQEDLDRAGRLIAGQMRKDLY